MLLDISPLCLYHNVPMILAQERRDPERILDPTYHWYACSIRGCLLRYDMGRGTTRSSMMIGIPLQRTRNHVMSVPTVFIWQSAEERLGIRSGFARMRNVLLTGGHSSSRYMRSVRWHVAVLPQLHSRIGAARCHCFFWKAEVSRKNVAARVRGRSAEPERRVSSAEQTSTLCQ